MHTPDIIIGVGGAAGDGVASAGNTLALSFARQGLGIFAYNSYQSVIRGGHSWLRLRVSPEQPDCHGDWLDALTALNQDSLDRHFSELRFGGLAVFNSDKVTPPAHATGDEQLCALPVPQLAPSYQQLPVMQNTVAVGAITYLLGMEFAGLESVLESTFAKKSADVIKMNVSAARAGFDYAADHCQPLSESLRVGGALRAPHVGFGKTVPQSLALVTGNELFALGAANAGCKFYCAYPMSPAGVVFLLPSRSTSTSRITAAPHRRKRMNRRRPGQPTSVAAIMTRPF